MPVKFKVQLGGTTVGSFDYDPTIQGNDAVEVYIAIESLTRQQLTMLQKGNGAGAVISQVLAINLGIEQSLSLILQATDNTVIDQMSGIGMGLKDVVVELLS